MRIHVLSDLHTEFYERGYQHAVDADVVVLAGDIGKGIDGVKWARKHFPADQRILYVLGNHEHYYGMMQETADKMRKAAEGSRIFIMDKNEFWMDDVRFLGATLWTDYRLDGTVDESMALAADGVLDHRVINWKTSERGDRLMFMPKQAALIFLADLAWLGRACPEIRRARATVVITHHAPSPKSIARSFVGDRLNPAFASNLDWFMVKHQPALWIHGHVHSSFDYKVANTRVICNPRGYPSDRHAPVTFENPVWNPDLVVEV